MALAASSNINSSSSFKKARISGEAILRIATIAASLTDLLGLLLSFEISSAFIVPERAIEPACLR